MIALSPFSTPLSSVSIPDFRNPRVFPIPNSSVHFQNSCSCAISLKRTRRLRSVQGVALAAEPETVEAASTAQEEPVSVPASASPADSITMHFQADGLLNESDIARVTKALEESEDISNLKVQISEGIGSVELTKQTTIQATGVASNLVAIIQGAGFRLQTLNLSFEDEDDVVYE